MAIQSATVGRILHYCAKEGDWVNAKDGDIRPAIVVRVWPNEYPPGTIWDHKSPADAPVLVECTTDGFNVLVFLDGTNDTSKPDAEEARVSPAVAWRCSAPITADACPGKLFWPPRA